MTLPNGKVLEKSFRGLAESQADLFAKTVRNGLLTGESTDKIARRLKGRLRFGQPGSLRQIAQAGGEVTAVAEQSGDGVDSDQHQSGGQRNQPAGLQGQPRRDQALPLRRNAR